MSATTPWTYDVMKERAMALTALYETSTASPACFGVVAGNFDGMGMSFGAIQYNLGTGNLQPIFQHMITNYEATTKTAFNYAGNPSYYNTFVTVMTTYTKTAQISWANSISNPANKHQLIAPWNTYFSALGITQPCIDKQVAMAEWYWNLAYNFFQEYKVLSPLPNMFSRRAYALFFDIAVQNGGISSTTKAQIVTAFNAINTSGKTAEEIETEKMVIIANKRADAVTSSFQTIVRERKLAIANGTGWVYNNTLYMDTAVYEMTMEEAFPIIVEQQAVGYFQSRTAEGRIADIDSAIGTTITSSNYPVNYTTMKTAGAKFIYHRVSTGMSVKDTQFTAGNISTARSAGLKVGFTHVAQPSNAGHSGTGKTVAGAELEANWFCDKIIETVGNDGGDILPSLTWLDGSSTWTNDDEAYNWIEAFNNIVKTRLNRNIILNTAYYYVDGNVTGTSLLKHSAKGGINQIMPLWLSANAVDIHGGVYPNYNFTAFGDYVPTKWDLWQYTTIGSAPTYGTAGSYVILNFMGNLNDNTVPVTPTGFAVEAGDTKNTLIWDISTNVNVTGYKVYRDSVHVSTVEGINTAIYEDLNLVNNVEYSYTISAITEWLESAVTASVEVTPLSAITSLYPYYPHVVRDEVITGAWSFTQDLTVDNSIVLREADFTNKTALDVVTNAGDGLQYLANDGTYKTVSTSGADTTVANTWTALQTFNAGVIAKAYKMANNAVTTGGNNPALAKYVHVARVYLIGTYNRVSFNLDYFGTGTTAKKGTIEAYVYNTSPYSTISPQAYVQMYVRDKFAPIATDVKIVKSANVAGARQVWDIYTWLSDYGQAYVNMVHGFTETGTLTINPANGALMLVGDLPIVSSTFSYDGYTFTVSAVDNIVIRTYTTV